jgi:hypothetical protein
MKVSKLLKLFIKHVWKVSRYFTVSGGHLMQWNFSSANPKPSAKARD